MLLEEKVPIKTSERRKVKVVTHGIPWCLWTAASRKSYLWDIRHLSDISNINTIATIIIIIIMIIIITGSGYASGS